MSTENWVVVATMGVYLLFMLWVGRSASHRVSDLDSYILAGRNLPWGYAGSRSRRVADNLERRENR